jgi:hypothetical protein
MPESEAKGKQATKAEGEKVSTMASMTLQQVRGSRQLVRKQLSLLALDAMFSRKQFFVHEHPRLISFIPTIHKLTKRCLL